MLLIFIFSLLAITLMILLNKTLNIIKEYNRDTKENTEDLRYIKEEIEVISNILSKTLGTYYQDIQIEKAKERTNR